MPRPGTFLARVGRMLQPGSIADVARYETALARALASAAHARGKHLKDVLCDHAALEEAAMAVLERASRGEDVGIERGSPGGVIAARDSGSATEAEVESGASDACVRPTAPPPL